MSALVIFPAAIKNASATVAFSLYNAKVLVVVAVNSFFSSASSFSLLASRKMCFSMISFLVRVIRFFSSSSLLSSLSSLSSVVVVSLLLFITSSSSFFFFEFVFEEREKLCPSCISLSAAFKRPSKQVE